MPHSLNEWSRSRLGWIKRYYRKENATSLSNCILGMSLFIITRMKGQNEIFSTDYCFNFWPWATINSHTGHRPVTTALKHSVKILQVVSFSCVVSKSSDFWLCPLILNSHLIRACICMQRKFNNQQSAHRHGAL